MKHPVLCPPADRAFAIMRSELQRDHPRWYIWENHFNATMTTRNSGVTLVCESWDQLALELEAEDSAQATKVAAA
jgi:hypothetical protein